MSIELKPCPFCGSTQIQTHNLSIDGECYEITCNSEGCPCGALFESVEDAQKAWNTRALEAENAVLKAKLLRAHRYSCTPTNCMLDGGVEHAQAFEKGGESDGQ
jgi:hypothetical protein